MTTNMLRHPAFELLGRYSAVVKAAWAHRHELAGPQRLADEAAFLPAALSLQDTPVHPAPRRAAIAICALFAIALTWSIVGQVDIVAVAQGRIVVSDRTKLVQPLEAGVVKAIHVKDGQSVRQGDVLIELDATAPEADAKRLAQERAAALSEWLRTRALIDALTAGVSPALGPIPAGEALEGSDRAAAAAQLSAEGSDISAKLARLDAEQARRRAELATAEQLIAKLQASLPLVRQREADFQALADQGFMSSHGTQDRRRERIEMEQDLATALARKAEARAALAESEQGRTAYRAETLRTLRERFAQADLKRGQLHEEAQKATQKTALTRLTAPVDGTVQQLAVHTSGGVVTPAQVLLVVVPEDGALTAEVVLENKDVGFVHAGQTAEVKLETFPFTRYGTVPAAVRTISADAVVDEKQGAVFPATLALQRSTLDLDGRSIRLAPGMNLTAEIKTGRRRVITYLLDPLTAHARESLGER